MIRRVVTSVTAGGQWGIEGYVLDDLDTSATITEGVDDDPIDVFGGVHIYARPAAGDRAEAVMLHVGGKADHPVLAALRNEDARARYVTEFEDLSAGEVVIFNSAGDARVKIKADGEIEITAAAGQKILLKMKAGATEPAVLKSEHVGHTHGPGTFANSGGSVTGISGGAAAITGSAVVELE